ncbi:MAG: hypothetical protein BRD52_02560 [Bacteroidetes bacterium SW_4_67_19]|nr:MAG: hypothetical protein BRD52_02560 [Bacteroidetes bacterium SW_4_67_19]
MTVHILLPQQQADTSAGASTAYDSVWAGGDEANASAQPPASQQKGNALEQTMLSHDKLYVVLAVVLLVWLGVVALLVRTDRRLSALEHRLDDTS